MKRKLEEMFMLDGADIKTINEYIKNIRRQIRIYENKGVFDCQEISCKECLFCNNKKHAPCEDIFEDDFDCNFEYILEELQKYLTKTTDTIENKTNKNEEEIKMENENVMMSNGFSEGFDFRKMLPNMKTETKVSMSLLGNGVVSKDGTETIYYTKEDGLSSFPFVGMVMSPMVFPCHITKIKEGDMILHNKSVVIVISSSKTKIKVVNPQTEAEYDFVPKKNFFIKEGFVAKVMTFDGIDFDGDNMLPMMMMMGGNNTMQGNMMLPMMMMMSGKDNDMKKLLPMLMMGGDQNQMLPMMMMMQDSDDISSMLPMMMMAGNQQQQQNPMMMLAMMSMLKKDNKNKTEDASTKDAINVDKEEDKE